MPKERCSVMFDDVEALVNQMLDTLQQVSDIITSEDYANVAGIYWAQQELRGAAISLGYLSSFFSREHLRQGRKYR